MTESLNFFIMARFSLEQKTEKKSKPVDFYVNWKSNDKRFQYWNGTEEVPLELPLKFAVIAEYHCVSGYSDKHSSRIYSNEVQKVGQDELIVRTFKPEGNIIAKGVWKDIKPSVEAQGGRYFKSIYAVLSDGTPVCFKLKGSAVAQWSTFTKENGGGYDNPNFNSVWVEINSAADQKKGTVKFSVPDFSVGKAFNAKEDAMIEAHAQNIGEYMRGYFSMAEEPEMEQVDEIDF